MGDGLRIYIAGPMRGIEAFNFPAFDAAAEQLRALGYEVFNPADHDREQHGDAVNDSATGDLDDIADTGFTLRAALAADAAWICEHADAVALLPGWDSSKGASAEAALGRALGLLVEPLAAFVGGVIPPQRREREPVVLAPLDAGEVRSVAASGAEKGVKLERFDLIPAEPLRLLARHYGVGSRKYTKYGECTCRSVDATLKPMYEASAAPATSGIFEPVTPSTPSASATSKAGTSNTEKRHELGCPALDVISSGDRNWERGYEWSKSFAALQRHIWAFWGGEDVDEETGSRHVIAAAWHCFLLAEFASTHPELDDRP
jgi:hypothetical protein